MKDIFPGARVTEAYTRIVLGIVQLLLMVVITLAIAILGWLLWEGVTAKLASIHTVPELQVALQRGFAGVLLVLLGLELMETVRTYLVEHRVRLEVIMIVAIIAVGRHIIQIDFEHTDGVVLLGISALVVALAVGYFLIRKAMSPDKPPG